MVLRRLLVAAMSLTVALALASATARSSLVWDQANVYRLRGDPRMCPSPMCGGFWASRVNRRSTSCYDGGVRPACYVASVDLSPLPSSARARAGAALGSSRALVRGTLAQYSATEFPQLARLIATSAWLAAGSGAGTGVLYRVVDTGIRCVRAPCFSFRATLLNDSASVTLSGLDFSKLETPPSALDRAGALLSRGGALISGPIRPGPPAGLGRVLVVTQLWLPA
jgi:hypothetical protein